ncbi:tetratricopeptide repeat protein [Candidatus Electronema sp. PJ]|uniref:tetratricopeptide repeat protein n=1 Tax=Candidatus Electronema sp. PJ TaxID=3401572 RepID=UPI003AA7F7F7
MNNVNAWIPYLQHPLVLAGFNLFIFALLVRVTGYRRHLPESSKLFVLFVLLMMLAVIILKRNDTQIALAAFITLLEVVAGAALVWQEKILPSKGEQLGKLDSKGLSKKAYQGICVLLLFVIVAGFAVNWNALNKNTPAQPSNEFAQQLAKQIGNKGGTKQPVSVLGNIQIGKDMAINTYGLTELQFSAKLKERQEGIVKAMTETGGNEEKRHLLEQEWKAVEEKLADLQHSYHEELQLRKAADEAIPKLKGLLPAAQLETAQANLQQGQAEAAEIAFDAVADNASKVAAFAAFQSGQLAEGRLDYAKAMQQYKKAVTLEPDSPDCLLAAGNVARTLANYEQAQIWLERLLKIREAAEKNDADLILAQNELAYVYYQQGKDKETEALLQRSLVLSEKILGKDHPDIAPSLNNLAGLYSKQGRYKEAEPLLQRTLSILQASLPAKHPHLELAQKNYDALKRKMAEH